MNICNIIAVIGMMATLMTSFNFNLNAETVFGCGCRTYGYSTITGEPCDKNVPGSGPVPDRLPIGDATDINANFWEQVSQIGIFGWASSRINSTNNLRSDAWITYSPSNGVVDVEEVFGIIKTNQLTLSVLYPSDMVNLQVGLYNKDGDNLFYGCSGSPIVPPRNGVSSNWLNVVLEMNSESWIPFGDVRWFEIIERDENNNPVRYYSSQKWDMWNGKIRFPNYFAKKFGEIRVTLCDGTEVAYRLDNGKQMTPTAVVMAVGNVSALGTRTFRDTNRVHIVVSLQESDREINPVVQYFVPVTIEKATISGFRIVSDGGDGVASIAQIPSGAFIWRYGSPSSTAQWAEMVNRSSVVVPVEPGQCYWVKLSFDEWPIGNQFNPPYQYNGGGGGAVTPTKIEEK